MQRVLRAVALGLVGVSWGWVAAAPPSAAALEIEHLFDYLAASKCTFIRNGRPHLAQEAVAHLERKYSYLLERDLITTAESFIGGAASRSSLTGRAYKVACPGEPERTSSAWFGVELARLRAGE